MTEQSLIGKNKQTERYTEKIDITKFRNCLCPRGKRDERSY